MQKLTREQAIQDNQGLVIKFAKRYVRPGIDFLDLIQEGNVGLLIAYEKFDPKYKNTFFTYAYYWVKQHIQNYVRHNIKPVDRPYLKPDDRKEAYKEFDFPLSTSHQNMALNLTLFDPTIEYFASEGMSQEDIIDFKNIWEKLYLDFDREYRIICKHFIEGYNLEDSGAEEGITKERARQICVETIQKIRERLKIKPSQRSVSTLL